MTKDDKTDTLETTDYWVHLYLRCFFIIISVMELTTMAVNIISES